MKINKDKKIELLVGKGSTQYTLHNPYLKEGRLIATNGHALVSIKAEEVENDTDGPVSVQGLKMARKACTRYVDDIELNLNGSEVLPMAGNATLPREDDNGFANVGRCLENIENRTFKVGLDAGLLLKLAKALGASGDRVELSFNPDDNLAGVVVRSTNDDDLGMIMPVRF